MSTLGPDKRVTARKKHECFFCGEAIKKGEKHDIREGVADGEFWRMRMHDECKAATKNWDYWDYENFTPGTLIRGTDEEQ